MISGREMGGLIVAPLPVFFLACLITVGPSFDGPDLWRGVSMALMPSYGLLIVIGFPLHRIIRHVGKTALATYHQVSIIATWAVIVILSLLEPAPPAPMANDNSPLAEISTLDVLISPLGLFVAGVSAVLAALTAGIFWFVVVRDAHLREISDEDAAL